jgi:hypothetical protein
MMIYVGNMISYQFIKRIIIHQLPSNGMRGSSSLALRFFDIEKGERNQKTRRARGDICGDGFYQHIFLSNP